MLKNFFFYCHILIFLFILLLANHSAIAQEYDNKKTIGSLEKELSNHISDSNKVKILTRLSFEMPCHDSLQRIAYAKKAIAISEANEWNAQLCDIYQALGDVYLYCYKNTDSTLKYYEIAYNIATRIKDMGLEIKTLCGLATFQKSSGMYSIALNNFNKIIEMSPGRDTTVAILGNIGEIYRSMGDNTKALQSYERSLDILNHITVTDKTKANNYTILRSGLLTTIAEVCIAMNEYDHALDNYKKALANASNVKDGMLAAYLYILSYKGIADCYKAKQQNDTAIIYYEKALAYARPYRTAVGDVAEILDMIGNIYLEKGNYKEAAKYIEEATQTAGQTDNKAQLSKCYVSLGKLHMQKKQYKKALDHLHDAVNMAKEIGALADEREAWYQLSSCYTSTGNFEKALEAYKIYELLKDSIYNADKAKVLTTMLLTGENDRKQFKDSVEHANENKVTHLRIQRQRTMIYSGFAGVLLMLGLAFFAYRNYSNEKKANVIITKANETIQEEKQISETLLLNILPEHVADELKAKGDVEARQFDNVTVFFSDFVNFTIAGEMMSPAELVAELHACFKAFDEIVSKYNIEKIKTVGDAYVAVSGLPKENANHAADMLSAALEIRDFMIARKRELGDKTFGIRIGLNSGTVVAGVVGVKKFAYDIWGDTVNTAARMEQNSENGKVNITDATYQIVKDRFACTYRGEIPAKNKGMMKMYFVEGSRLMV
jgi:class 3 adenylate cyclase/Tfp pilus assembly protein PilF